MEISLEEMESGARTNQSAEEEEEAEAVVEIGATIPLGLAAVEVPTSNHKVGALVINNNHSNHKVEEDLDVEEETC